MKNKKPILAPTLLLLPLLALLLTATAWAEECVLLQSSGLKPYAEAGQGFEKTWNAKQPLSGPKSITLGTLTRVVLSEQPEENRSTLKKLLQSTELVVVIGDPALAFVRDLRATPVLYLLAPSAKELPANFTGIDMRILPSRQLETMSRLIPNLRRVGALYNPAESGHWVQEALTSPASAVETLLFKKVTSPSLVPEALAGLGNNAIDAYWMLPDELVTNPQTMEHLRDFSIANRVPIVSFSDKYLKAGAAAAITFDMADMGRQAADMAARILAGEQPAAIPVESPCCQRVIVNTSVFRKMMVPINEIMVDEIYSGETRP
jgi:putative ABC transport system substrate-binding protein